MIKALTQLYDALDKLFYGISDICKQCDYDDCMGYHWLLPEEAEKMLNADIELLEVNDCVSFINPFSLDEIIDVERLKPTCPWFKNHLCQIRPLRPLVCRMYPLSFAAECSKIYLVLHLDCEYSRKIQDNDEFQQKAINLFRQLSPGLFRRIINTYRLVDNLTKFPYGQNLYLKLADESQLIVNLKKGGHSHVEMQSRDG